MIISTLAFIVLMLCLIMVWFVVAVVESIAWGIVIGCIYVIFLPFRWIIYVVERLRERKKKK